MLVHQVPAGQQLVEMVALSLFEPFVIQRETFDDVSPQPLRGPDAKLRAPLRFHPVANRDDDVEVIEPSLVAFAVSGSCQEFLDN